MYKEIEELEKMLRNPAASEFIDYRKQPINVTGNLVGEEVVSDGDIERPVQAVQPPAPVKLNPNTPKKLYDMPKASEFTDPSVVRIRPSGTKDSVFGGAAPDYSGYDRLLENIPKPRDTSLIDLASMGIATGLGAMFGQVGVGASNAGKFGLSQADKADKRANAIEDMIVKLNLDRAAQMAKGTKGTKIKGDTPLDLTKYKYEDSRGFTRIPQFIGEDGSIIKDPSDLVYKRPTTQFTSRELGDGSKEYMAAVGPDVTSLSLRGAPSRAMEDVKGNLAGYNQYSNTMTPVQGVDKYDPNKGVSNYSPKVKEEVDKIQQDYSKDNALEKLRIAHSDITLALESLPTATAENLLLIKRMLGMAMDKGRSLTNEEFANVSNIELGLLNKMQSLGNKWTEGESTNKVRQAYEKMAVGVEKEIRRLYDEKAKQYNDRLKIATGDEFNPRDSFSSMKAITAKSQMAGADYITAKSAELSAGSTRYVTIVLKDGTRKRVKVMYNPATKKNRIIEE